MRSTNIVMLASLNKGKITEYKSLFKQWPEFDFKTLPEIVWNVSSLDETETGKTYYENAFLKGQVGHLAAKVPTISDDTGLEVDALGGKPGIFSARYAGPLALDSKISKDEANIKKLLEELQSVPKEKRTARFVCTLIFFVEGLTLTASGTLEGSILESPRGGHGFGYDSIFLVRGTDKSLAEMSLEEKNKISHRAQALQKIISDIKQKNIQLVRP